MGLRRLAMAPQSGGCGRRAAIVPRRGGASVHPHKQQHFSKACPQTNPAGARDDDNDDNDDDAGGDDDDNGNTNNNNSYGR